MAIQAQLADGRVLEFPDGTNPAVIQATVKRLISAKEPEPAPAAAPPYAEEQVAPSAPTAQPTPAVAEAPKKPGAQPFTELRKGAMRAATSDLPSMWESAGILKDVGAAATVQERLALFDRIDKGEITSLDQLRGLDMSTGQARSYFSTSPENRARMKERAVNELGSRKKLVDAAVKTIEAYRKDAEKYNPAVDRPRDIGSVADFTNWVAGTVGSGAVQIVPLMLAAAATGGMGVAAVGTAMGVSESVSKRLEFIKDQVKDLPPEQQADRIFDYIQKTGDTSLATGIISGAFDTVLGPAARLVKVRAGAVAPAATRKEAVKRELKETPKQMLGETATGAAQEATQIGAAVRLGEKEAFATRENLLDIIEAGLSEGVGSLGGAGINVGAAAVRRPAGTPEAVPPTAPAERVEPTFEEAPPAAPPERIEPTLEAGAMPPTPEPGGRIEPTLERAPEVPTVPEVSTEPRMASIAERAEQLKATLPFLSDAEALEIAKTREARAQAKEEQRAAIEPPIFQQPEPGSPQAARVQELFDDALAQGVAPEQAIALAQQQFALEQQEAKGEARATESVRTPSGEGAGVAGVAPTGAPAEGVAGTERAGVVSPAEDVGQPAVGEGEQPSAVAETTTAPAETPPKGKRGRPKAELTPEQQALKAAERGKRSVELTRADRQTKRAVQTIEATTKPLDEGEFESEEALAEARSEQTAQRREAIKSLLQVEAQFRGAAVGNRAKAALQDAKLSQKEVADLRKGMEAMSGAKKAVFKEGVAPVNKTISAATSANQALTSVINNGSPFQRILSKRLRGLINNTRFVVLEEGDALPEELKPYERDWNRANGMFVPPLNAIYVRGASFGRAQGVNNVTALHEMLHAATVNKIATGIRRYSRDAAEYKKLQQFVGDLVVTSDIAKDVYERRLKAGTVPEEVRRLVERTNGEVFSDPMEFLAYGMTDPDFQLFLMRVPGRMKDETAFSEFVRALMRLFGIGPGDYSAFSDLVNITDKILSERVQPSKDSRVSRPLLQRDEKLAEQEGIRSAKELRRKARQAIEGLRKSKTSDLHKNMGALQKVRDQNPVNKALDAIYSKADYKTKQVLADAPSFDFIARWTEKDLPMVKDAYEAVQKIVGHTHELRETAVSQVQMLDRDFKKDKALEDKLNGVLYASTVAEIDPSNPRALERDPELTRMYEDLGDDGKAAYRRVVDYHEGLRDYQEYLLDKIIKDLPGLDEDTKRNMLTQIYKKFQEERRIEPYIPLVRDTGDFWLAVGDGDNIQIYVYETREQRQEDAERIAREQYLGKSVGELLETEDFAMINEADELRSRVDIKGSLLSQLFDVIDKRVPETPEQATKLTEANQQLKNDMFDIWLSAMPEQAFRKQFVHRKGRAGYRPDIKRNIATHIARVAPALARLRYGQELRSQQIRLRAAVRSREDLTPFKQSVDQRIDAVLNPQAQTGFWDSFAGAANKLTYLTYLTGAATAFLQPMSIYISALPILIANHGANPVRVAKELGKMVVYMKQYSTIKTLPDGDTKYTAPTLANNKTLPEDERRAIRAMVSMNVSQQTYSGFLWDAAKGLDDDIVKGKGAKAADLLFNALLRNTERLTREVVYLAAYRLGRQRGLSEQDAIMQAASDVKESLGDYDTMNRPTWMQGPFGRVVFSMKMYPVVVTQQLFGNMYRMTPFLNKEGKKQAFIKFSGIMMTTATLAGIYNAPFADLIITMLTKFLEDQDDDDLPEELKDKDPVLWFKTVWMPNKLGEFSIGGVPLDEIIGEGPLTALTGRAVGQRIGLNDLWFRDGKPSPDLATAAQSFMLSFFPFASYGTSVLKAVEDFMIGDYQKAMERSVPLATARNFLIANRISKEGFTTPKGELVPPENVTTADVIWQGMGFSPADVAAARETSFKLTGEEQKVLIQRNQLIRKLKFADRKDDDKLMDKVEAEIEAFNEKNPEQELTPDQIYQILIAEDEKRAAARAGVSVTDKNTRLFEQSVENIERRLERRQQK